MGDLNENVREAIRVILMTEFGGSLAGFQFELNTVTTRRLIQDHITKALAQREPRIAVESVEVAEDPQDPQAAVATITYRLVASQVRERVSLNVQFGLLEAPGAADNSNS